jgi:hypothetical protein
MLGSCEHCNEPCNSVKGVGWVGGIYWPAERLSVSQQWPCSVEFLLLAGTPYFIFAWSEAAEKVFSVGATASTGKMKPVARG